MKKLFMVLMLAVSAMTMTACNKDYSSDPGLVVMFKNYDGTLTVGQENNQQFKLANCNEGTYDVYYESGGVKELITQVTCAPGSNRFGYPDSFDLNALNPSLVGGTGVMIVEGTGGTATVGPIKIQ